MTRLKIVLYNPEAVFHTMPLSLLAVGSALDPDRYEVRIVDARLERDPWKRLASEIQDADLLGLSVLTGAPIRDAVRMSRLAKDLRPELPVVWGGWHPSLFATETLTEGSIDFAVQGQGEVTFAELTEALGQGAPVDRIQGLARRGADGVALPPTPRALVELDELPRHNYELLQVESYFRYKKQRQLDYVTSTGCLFRCAFCADPFVYKRRWVALSPARIGAEIEALWDRYRFEELAFQDETFFTYRKRVAAIAEEFLTRNLRFAWTATLRADEAVRLTGDIFELCVRSGLRRVMVGVESGSQEMLDWMKKDITIEQVIETAELCRTHGVAAIFPFIVGFPGESDGSVQESLDLIKRLRAMSPSFETPLFYYKPYPGSDITQEVVRLGYELPSSLEEWADFDFVESAGPWVSPKKRKLIERFKFYNRFAGGPETWRRRPLQLISRWRCRRDVYGLPFEKLLLDRLWPMPRLS